MNTGSYWLVFIVAFLALIMLTGVKQAETKSTRVCVNVELPKPGNCKRFTYRGYRVGVCK